MAVRVSLRRATRSRSGAGMRSRQHWASRRQRAAATLLRPLRAEVGLEPERPVAHDQAGLVGAVEEPGERLELDAARLGEALRVGQRESALRELAGRLAAELREQLGGRRHRRVGGLRGSPLEQAAIDVVDAHEHRRGGRCELVDRWDVPGRVHGEAGRHGRGHVHAPLGDHDEEGGRELAQERRRGIRQFGGRPERDELRPQRLDRGVAVLVGDRRCRGQYREVAPVEPAQCVVDRVGGEEHLGQVEQVAHPRGIELARLQGRREVLSRQPAESCGELEHRRRLSSIRPARRGIGERRSR